MAQLKSTNITGNLSVTGNVLASKIIKFGGTNDDILMGDGSITSKQGLIDSLEAAMEGNSWRPVKYGTTTVNDTSTTLEFIAGSNIGLTFNTNGQLTIANNYSYSLPLAANGTRGGIQVGYTASGANLPVQLSSEKAYVALTKTAVESVVTIPTVYDGTLTLKASDGATATQQTFTANDADNVTFEVKHAVPTGASATSYGPSEGGTQEAKKTLDIIVPQITTDKFGHVTGVTNKTFKVTDTNTDTKVTQSDTTTANWRKVVLSKQDSATMGTATAEKTDVVYVTPKIEAQPSTGSLRMTGNLLLHNPDGGDSPKLIFQRGDEKGTVTDWNMYVNQGALKINSIPTSGSTAETKIAEFAYHGGMTIHSPNDTAGAEIASMTIKTSNGGQLILGKEGPNSGTMLRFDQDAGTARLRFRASSTAGAMVWEQPESNSSLYLDVSNVDFRNTTGIKLSQFKSAGYLYTDASGNLKSAAFPTIPSVPSITITDTGTKPIVGDITADGHTITVSRIGLSDLGLASAYKYKDSLANLAAIEAVPNPAIGDVYNAQDTGMNYAWNGTTWDALGSTIDVSGFVQKPSSSTTSGLAYFTDTTGKTLGSSKTTISAAGLITVPAKTGIAMTYTSGGDDVWLYPKGADTYGIRYFEGTPDAMAFSATANNSTKAGADLCINGNGDGTVTMRGKNIATQEWVTTQLGTSGSFDLSKYTEGAASSTDNAIVRFDGTSGKKIQNSTATISDAGHLSINTMSDTTMTTPAVNILHTGPQDGSSYADLMVLAGYKGAPYGFKFRTYGNGTAIIQSQRISGGAGEKFPLSLNPDGGDVLMNGKLIATQDWVTAQLGSGGSGSNSEWAKFLKPQSEATSDGASTWTASSVGSNWKRGWSQKFAHSSISSDTGDINFWLRPSAYASNATELCVVIDGDFYGHTGSKRVAYKDELPTVNNGTLTLQTSGQGISGDTTTFTANQSGNATFAVTLNSSPEGNRKANQVVIAKADGTINSAKYTITKTDGVAKASWQYNDSTDCVELVW
jgi:hypothetical protein